MILVRQALASMLLLLALIGPAAAVNPDEVLDDPALEARARALSLEFRCLVCQNQSIDDSNAELARTCGGEMIGPPKECIVLLRRRRASLFVVRPLICLWAAHLLVGYWSACGCRSRACCLSGFALQVPGLYVGFSMIVPVDIGELNLM